MTEHGGEQRKPFAQFLQEQRSGGLHGELSEALKTLVQSVDEHRKAGTLTLTVKVAPNADGVTVTVTDKIVLKAPEAERGAAIFFIDNDGSLQRRDPRQIELPLREVERPAVREVGDDAVNQ